MTKSVILTACGVIGGILSTLFGGLDAILYALLWAMAADYITGLLVAGVFHNSRKTKNGTLESRAGFKGLCRKGVILLVVLVGAQLDTAIGCTFIRDGVVLAYLANETISILENIGLMGVPVPAILQRAIAVLQKKAETKEEDT